MKDPYGLMVCSTFTLIPGVYDKLISTGNDTSLVLDKIPKVTGLIVVVSKWLNVLKVTGLYSKFVLLLFP